VSLKPRSLLLLACLAFGLSACVRGGGHTPSDRDDVTWPMHPIAHDFRGANALSPGDVNQDGFLDYVTNYEFDQRYVISFHPGATGNVKEPWPQVVAWMPEVLASDRGVNPEHSSLGDFDGDGNLDIVTAQGWSNVPFWEGSQPGIRLVWGPPPAEVFDEESWTDAGRIPETIDRGHMIYVQPYDVNNDGAMDIISGGRVHGGNNRKGGVIWIEAPSNPADRRDLSQWQIHDIDSEQFCAHGLAITDIDQDGDEDFVLANADFDTPEDQEKVVWYENPGSGSPEDQRLPWPMHLIYQGNEFYAKPQLAVADLDQDGFKDVLTQVEQSIYYFRKTSVDPVTWEMVVIDRDPVAQWLARPIRVVDINGDDKLDLVGMLLHNDGTLPGNKAAAFWMEYSGPEPLTDNWTTHVIKWGTDKTMMMPMFGEKWDQVNFSDVDQDGDLDIIANCEEWWESDFEFKFFWNMGQVETNSVAVVWFENRLNEQPVAGKEAGGLCVIEAEHYAHLKDCTWIIRAKYPGYVGDGYMRDHRALDGAPFDWSTTRGLEYTVDVEGGTYYLWMRCRVPRRWGYGFSFLGAIRSDSAWLGVDGEAVGGVFDDGSTSSLDQWSWVRATVPADLSAGTHTVNLRVREAGYAVDRILLTTNPDYTPSGPGPDETL